MDGILVHFTFDGIKTIFNCYGLVDKIKLILSFELTL